MPDDWYQVSGPEHQSLCSTSTSTSHLPAMSRPGATPEPRSLPSQQNSEAVDADITWPVPQVMVHYDGMEFACGRQAITDMGKKGFLEWMFQRFLWTPKPKYDLYRTFYFDSSRFSKEADILGTFYHIHARASDADL
ncbi:hypothetical protein LXA43DRAFT_709979 [Ganoderma leucocontextum]|nr:hypothetical protein LXA43DRAFT_709979 [Ganoderma leucocontextum]